MNRLVELLKHKTNYLENSETNLDLQSVLEHFRIIDSQCQGSLHELNNNNLLTSSDIVVQFIDEIQGIENKTNESVIETIMIKPTTVQVWQSIDLDRCRTRDSISDEILFFFVNKNHFFNFPNEKQVDLVRRKKSNWFLLKSKTVVSYW